MLTDQASLRVQVPRRELLNLRGDIKNLMRKHDMMRDDLCHLRAAQCDLRFDTGRCEVKVKPSTIAYPALHPAILGLVDDMHGLESMQTTCKGLTRPILHITTRPRCPIRAITWSLSTRCSSASVSPSHPR